MIRPDYLTSLPVILSGAKRSRTISYCLAENRGRKLEILEFSRSDKKGDGVIRKIVEKSGMKMRNLFLLVIALAAIGTVSAAGPAKFDGEFVDKKFLNGQGVIEFSVHQSGSALEIAFDAAYSDGHGATPDATGAGKVNGNAAQFTWKDSQGNTGTGTINLAGDDIVVSMKTVHVADPRCLAFYRDNMKLKRTGKK